MEEKIERGFYVSVVITRHPYHMDVLYTVVMLSDVDEDEVSVREEGEEKIRQTWECPGILNQY